MRILLMLRQQRRYKIHQQIRRHYMNLHRKNSYNKDTVNIDLVSYDFEAFRRELDTNIYLSSNILNQKHLKRSPVKIDLALGLITKNTIEALKITSESEQREIFNFVKRLFCQSQLPLVPDKSGGRIARESIEDSINFVINQWQLEGFRKKFMSIEVVNSEDKLEIFQKTFSKKMLDLLPNLLIGQKGNLWHGFVDKSIQASALKICTLLVALDNVSNGWRNNTYGEVENRAERSFNFILATIILMGLIAAFIKLAETIAQNREEDLDDLENEYANIKQQRENIIKIVEASETVVKEIFSQKSSYFFTTYISKEETAQIIAKISNKKLRSEVQHRFEQIFAQTGEDKISVSGLKRHMDSILSQDFDTLYGLEKEVKTIKKNHKMLMNQINDEKDWVNILLASKDFVTGYPKHCVNQCTEALFNIRFFEKSSTRDSFLGSKPQKESNVKDDDDDLKKSFVNN
ncbi:hypothetical protein [Legionella israelensis]|uniref:Uncharacterized protein n=1 Tax=Legionella israelensis TaxID=454 RepID=A0A0W0VHK1_9GAMM|nr:hypothetical protein [Legionella israelensis]KTD19614.1 hypothetical protein Lisr_1900 [Legionella israelensis]QBS09607.1 hypothetical protein E4T55_06875 [Legionella israelensis]SCY58757.1 hypothetical protein SAMN02746069_02961 [Legionella israelensis DSM 19235]STX60532.1 Uncharacterised protein [Legionella israelensis]